MHETMTKELHIHIHPDAAVMAALLNLERKIEMDFAQATAAVQAQTELLVKISAESSATLQKVADLQAVIDSMNQAGQTVPPELEAAIAALSAQVNAVDALVPDATP